jgi:putative endonuclease
MYVYILKSKKDGSFYIGSTKDVVQRLQFHNRGLNRSTKAKIPWSIVKVEEYSGVSLALKREKFLKSGDGRKVLKNLLR